MLSKHDQLSFRDLKKDHLRLARETHGVEERNSKNKKFKFIDLFCGIGGIRQSFENYECGCVFSSDIDTFAQYTYYKNYRVVPYGDIVDLENQNISIPDHDILCAGFPCQPFSKAGSQSGFKDSRGNIFFVSVRLGQFFAHSK